MPPTAMTLPVQRRPEHDEQWELVDQAQGGDAEAFGALYRICAPTIRAYVHHRLADAAAADDIVAETFRRAWQSIDRVRYAGVPYVGFLQSIAGNLVKDHFKSKHTQLSQPLPPEDFPHNPVAPDDVEAEAVQRDMARILRDALGRLNPMQRRVLELRYLEERSISEVARILGKDPGAVKALTYRASRNLLLDPALRGLVVIV